MASPYKYGGRYWSKDRGGLVAVGCGSVVLWRGSAIHRTCGGGRDTTADLWQTLSWLHNTCPHTYLRCCATSSFSWQLLEVIKKPFVAKGPTVCHGCMQQWVPLLFSGSATTRWQQQIYHRHHQDNTLPLIIHTTCVQLNTKKTSKENRDSAPGNGSTSYNLT